MRGTSQFLVFGTLSEFKQKLEKDPGVYQDVIRKHFCLVLGNVDADRIIPWLVENKGLSLQFGHYLCAENHWVRTPVDAEMWRRVSNFGRIVGTLLSHGGEIDKGKFLPLALS